MTEVDRFVEAKKLFDDAHSEDPRRIEIGDKTLPFAIAYHRALGRWVVRLHPNASEALKLAAMSQHIRRHMVPRQDFPMDLAGYKRWRSTLAQRHASEAREILSRVGYDEATISRVADFILKKGLRKDEEVALFEDAICLVFLELELSAFAAKHAEEKVIDVLRKTWAKMTPRGQTEALAMLGDVPAPLRAMLERAVVV